MEKDRKLASIQKIKNIEDIEFLNNQTNKLEKAQNINKISILGWHLVAQKNLYNIDDFVVYCEIDSFLPDVPCFDFLRKGSGLKSLEDGSTGFRIKTIKLKGQISQGIVFPVSIFSDFGYVVEKLSDGILISKDDQNQTLAEGDDVSDILNIKKWELPIPANLKGEIKGNFPGFLIKTDEIRIQAIPEILENFSDVAFYYTEKLDGTSATFYYKDEVFGVCSRNLDIKENESNTYWQMAKKYDLEKKLKDLNKNIAIQGEIIGPGVQKNKLQLKDVELRIFNIFDIDAYKYYNFKEFNDLILNFDLKSVPIFDQPIYLKDFTVDQLVELSKGFSTLNSQILREGIVFKTFDEIQDSRFGRLGFKVINPDFLLKYD